jgi:quinol-cytochrome oxidoreductase complex cytochrome b subunit
MNQRKGPLSRLYDWFNERIDVNQVLGWFLSASGLIYGGLDRRIEFREALEKALKKPVPKHVNWTFCFGGMTFFLFIIQVFTGILLTLYYRPTPEGAYESVRHITNHVSFGWLIRGIHHWASNIMILMVVLHMLRVYFYGAYKRPRELNWLAGVGLLGVTLAFGFTGYLLPWDQVAYWATTVGSQIAGAVPIVGPTFLLMMRGGEMVTGETLTRFFSAHVIILPVASVVLLAFHFLMIRRQGISGPL